VKDKPENISVRLPERKNFELYGVYEFKLGRSQGQFHPLMYAQENQAQSGLKKTLEFTVKSRNFFCTT
jgi:hypothetical protein